MSVLEDLTLSHVKGMPENEALTYIDSVKAIKAREGNQAAVDFVIGETENTGGATREIPEPNPYTSAVFPSTQGHPFMSPPNDTPLKAIGGGIMAGLEAVGTPYRMLGALRKDVKMTDPDAGILAPEARALRESASNDSGTSKYLKHVGALALDVVPDMLSGGGARSLERVANKGLRKAGKRFLESSAKIPKTLLKKVNRDPDKATKKMIGWIDKYNLESPLKGFRGVADKTENAIDKTMNMVDDLTENVSKLKTQKTDIDKIVYDFVSDVVEGKTDFPLEYIEKAGDVAIDQLDLLKKYKGISGKIGIKDLIKAKKELSKNVFKKGVPNVNQDPVKDKVKELLTFKLLDKIGEIEPRINKYNRKLRDLILLKPAMEDAANRTGKHNIINSLGNIVGASVLGTAGATHNPWLAGLSVGSMATNAALRKGRGASGLIKAGKLADVAKLQQYPMVSAYSSLADKTIDDLQKWFNEKRKK